MHNTSFVIKDDIMHCLNQSPPIIIHPIFSRIFLIFKMRKNSSINCFEFKYKAIVA
jgi:hypothetical protein